MSSTKPVNKLDKKILIVGAGPSGLTAGRLLAEAGCQVRILDQRNHIAGNCYDETDEHGVLLHRYGPHYFRTSSRDLLDWLNQFTDWIPGRYYVRASVAGKLIPLPIILASMTALKQRIFTREIFEGHLEQQREYFNQP